MLLYNRRKFVCRFAKAVLATSIPFSANASIYLVKKGDTLSDIGKQHGTSVRELKAINKLDTDLIRIGQKLKIPESHSNLADVRSATSRIKVDTTKWKYIVAHHSATPHGNAKSYDQVDRKHGMENGLAYHFVIGNGRDSKEGGIEIGSRWTKQLHGGHVSKWDFNNHGIGICLVGNFEKQRPSQIQLESFKALVNYLGNDLLDGSYKFFVHKEINATLCPGRYFPSNDMHRIFG